MSALFSRAPRSWTACSPAHSDSPLACDPVLQGLAELYGPGLAALKSLKSLRVLPMLPTPLLI